MNINYLYNFNQINNVNENDNENDNDNENNNIKYIYNYDNDFYFLFKSIARKDPEIKNKYILPSKATFIKIPDYNKDKEYLIFSKLLNKWDILKKKKIELFLYNTNNYNKFIKKHTLYYQPNENFNIILNKFKNTLNKNEIITYIEIPYYNHDKQSIYFTKKKNNWLIKDYLDNIIEIYLYDNNNFNKFLEKKNIYYSPFENLNIFLDKYKKENNIFFTISKIPNYNKDKMEIYYDNIIDKWNIININDLDEYIKNINFSKNKLSIINKFNEINKNINKNLNDTDFIFLIDNDDIPDITKNIFKKYRKDLRQIKKKINILIKNINMENLDNTNKIINEIIIPIKPEYHL